MAGGRPRTITPEPEELISLGKELVTWASEPTEELRCRFAQWYSIVKGITHYEWDKMVEKPEFRGYYEKAQTFLGQKYIDGSVKEGIAHRFLRRYCPEVKREENEKAEFEANLKKPTKTEEDDAFLRRLRAFLAENNIEVPRTEQTERPDMEDQQPLLDQG